MRRTPRREPAVAVIVGEVAYNPQLRYMPTRESLQTFVKFSRTHRATRIWPLRGLLSQIRRYMTYPDVCLSRGQTFDPSRLDVGRDGVKAHLDSTQRKRHTHISLANDDHPFGVGRIAISSPRPIAHQSPTAEVSSADGISRAYDGVPRTPDYGQRPTGAATCGLCCTCGHWARSARDAQPRGRGVGHDPRYERGLTVGIAIGIAVPRRQRW